MNKPCLMCRIFGHKWIDVKYKTVTMAGVTVKKPFLAMFEKCPRCGTESPWTVDETLNIRNSYEGFE